MLLSPYAVFQQSKLTQVEALRQTNHVLEDELQFLQQQQQQIQAHVQQITDGTKRLTELQTALSTIKALDNSSIQQLEQQIQESKEILSRMDQSAQAFILQNLVSVLVSCDADQNMILKDQEIDSLIHSLECIHGVQLREDKIRQTILQHNRSITAIMEIARNVIAPPQGGNTAPLPTISTTDTGPSSDGATLDDNDSMFSYIVVQGKE
jgi:hypothetical protein